jgi:cysteinyl-tRNA synthetase
LNENAGLATAFARQLQQTYSLLGVFVREPKEYFALFAKEEIPEEVQAIAKERFEARQNKDWAKSDELREKLASLGYAVKDSKTGYELTKL